MNLSPAKALCISVGVLVILLVVIWLTFYQATPASAPIINEKEPTAEITYQNASKDLIVVELPFPGAVTGKEFKVIGQARGTWFFEASFPIEVLDKDGKALLAVSAKAKGEWMTEDFVPFEADIKVPNEYIGPAILVLHKDNPSGLPEKDASVSFPITIEY